MLLNSLKVKSKMVVPMDLLESFQDSKARWTLATSRMTTDSKLTVELQTRMKLLI